MYELYVNQKIESRPACKPPAAAGSSLRRKTSAERSMRVEWTEPARADRTHIRDCIAQPYRII